MLLTRLLVIVPVLLLGLTWLVYIIGTLMYPPTRVILLRP